MQFKKEDMLTDRSAKLIFVAIGMQQHEDEVIFVQYPGGTPLGSTQLRIVRKPLGPLQSFFENPGDKLVVPLLHF